MIDYTGIDKVGWTFFKVLHESIGADTTAQVSMYDIGATAGLDKTASSRIAQELIGWGLVEIKTLSGAIGITGDGVEVAQVRFGGAPDAAGPSITLADAPIVSSELRSVIEDMMVRLKAEAVCHDLPYEKLEELMANLKTIDAQMTSPRPRSAILREIFLTVKQIFNEAGAIDSAARIHRLVGM